MSYVDKEIGYRFTPKIKTKKVKLSEDFEWDNMDIIMRYINDDGDVCRCFHFHILKDNSKYPTLNIDNGQPECIMLQNPKLDNKDEPNTDVYITHHNIIPISLKLST